MSKTNLLKSLKVKKVSASLIEKADDYIVSIVNFELINSFEKNLKHEQKDDLKTLIESGELWCDPTPQIAITFGDKDGKGVITHRFNLQGYVHSDDSSVTDEMLNREDILVIDKYVCKETKNGYERITSDDKTESALNILFTFLNKLGFDNEDMDVETALTTARKDKYYIVATVCEDEWNGKTRMVIDKFNRARLEDVEPVDDGLEDDLE